MNQEHMFINHLTRESLRTKDEIINQSLIELVGDSRILIENHLGVHMYREDCIGVLVRFGSLQICGSRLEIVHMTKDTLLITGKINQIELCRREKK